MTYPMPSWTNDPTTSDPIDAENLSLYNSAIDGLDSRTTTIEAAGAVNALATAKGDMIAAHASADMSTLPVGTDGQVLTADASATLGVDWADPAPGGVSSVTAGDTSIHVDNTDPINPTVIVNQSNLTVAESQVTGLTTDLAAKQPLDSDLTTIAALTPGSGNVMAADGAGWISKTYAALKTALGLVKADVGLSNVDNTADTAKPVSTAQQTALDLKQDLSAKGAASGYASLDGSTKVPIAQLPTGTSSTTVAIGNDSRLSDARTPTAHHTTHSTGGTDAIAPADIGAQPVNSDLTAIAAATPGAGNVLAADGAGWVSKTYTDLKASLDLNNVDNTSDATKNAAAVTLTNKTLTAPVITSPTGIVKGDVGLGSVTNDAQVTLATVTAKGDLLAATASATVTNLAVGSDGDVLVADSTQAAGVAWTTPAASGVASVTAADGTITVDNTDPANPTVAVGDVPGVAWPDRVETLADASSFQPDCLSGLIQVSRCGGQTQDATLFAPNNPSPAQTWRFHTKANGADWVITPSGFVASTDWSTAPITVPQGSFLIFTAVYEGAVGWIVAGKLITS